MKLKWLSVEKKVVPVAHPSGRKSVFKHVLYIIKETEHMTRYMAIFHKAMVWPFMSIWRKLLPKTTMPLQRNMFVDKITYCNGCLVPMDICGAYEGFVTDYLKKVRRFCKEATLHDGMMSLALSSGPVLYWIKFWMQDCSFRNYAKFYAAEIENKWWQNLDRAYNQFKAAQWNKD